MDGGQERHDDPLDDPAWRAHLFAVRSEAQLGAWARSLRWFRICRALPSPFLKESDRLVVALSWVDAADLGALLGHLDLPAAAGSRPGWCDLGGHRVHARVVRGRLELAVSGAEQRRVPLVDRDIEAAQAIEQVLADAVADMADRVIDPPVDDRSCLAPRRYARLFDERQ